MLSAMDVDSVSGGGTGSARRRRERRLRQFLRHERLSVAMALSEMKHQTSRGQSKDGAGGEARVALHGRVPEAPLPQGRILRHVVGHLPVLALDVPVPQMVDQPVDILKIIAMLSPAVEEQVIDVPKIIQDPTPQRLVPSEPQQLAEQLVDVPVPSVHEVTVFAPFVDTAGRTRTFISGPDGRQVRRVHSTSSGPARKGSPPVQGGI